MRGEIIINHRKSGEEENREHQDNHVCLFSAVTLQHTCAGCSRKATRTPPLPPLGPHKWSRPASVLTLAMGLRAPKQMRRKEEQQ